jgi:hypothetical protein
MSLESRLKRLEQAIKPPPEERRIILAWRDEEGRLTKVADSHPDWPDDYPYFLDMTRPAPEGAKSAEDDNHVQNSQPPV